MSNGALETNPLSEQLAAYYISGNAIPVERASIPAELAHRIIADLRRFEYLLEYEWMELCSFGGDADEIRDGIDMSRALNAEVPE